MTTPPTPWGFGFSGREAFFFFYMSPIRHAHRTRTRPLARYASVWIVHVVKRCAGHAFPSGERCALRRCHLNVTFPSEARRDRRVERR